MPSPATSPALTYFNQLMAKEDLWQYLHDLPEKGAHEEKVETDWREFKGFDRIEDKTAKEKFAQALSGFANTEGGVLIWGLDCRDDQGKKLDEVQRSAMRKHPAQFAQMLRDYIIAAVDPLLSGVEYKPVANDADEGYVICYIPEGSVKPYRSQWHEKFFIRVGASFKVPGVSLLRSMFYSRSVPRVIPFFVVQYFKSSVPVVELNLRNEGTGTAENLCLHISYTPEFDVIDVRNAHVLNDAQDLRQLTIETRTSVHPGLSFSALLLRPRVYEIKDAFIENVFLTIYCRDNAPMRWECEFIPKDLKKVGDTKQLLSVNLKEF